MSFSANKKSQLSHTKTQTSHTKSTDISSLIKTPEGASKAGQAINEVLSSLNLEIDKKEVYRFLLFNSFDIKKTIYSIRKHYLLKSRIHLKDVDGLLNLGYIYICKRDKFNRPNIILNVPVYEEARRKNCFDEILQSILYIGDYVIDNFLTDGYAEQFNLIIDVKNWRGNFDKHFKDLVNTVVNYFPMRFYCVYIINCDDLTALMWNLLGMGMKKLKIKVYKEGNRGYIEEIGNTLETKYGGDYENIEGPLFFPPKGIHKVSPPSVNAVKEEEFNHKRENIIHEESLKEAEEKEISSGANNKGILEEEDIISSNIVSKEDINADISKCKSKVDSVLPPVLDMEIIVHGKKEIKDCPCSERCSIF